ncbi:MAG: WxcM-like domain-containing protein [Thermoflexales bacterium]|nr:WxcM-like domain-containing protein [Thermoflexales bacterium]
MSIDNCRIIQLPKILNAAGNLTFVESDRHIPFDIKRVYYLYDVPGGAMRGGHAHKALHQLIIAMSGSFDVLVDDGSQRKRFHMNRSYYGLYVCPMIWRELDNFSSGAVCLVLASEMYDESDYFREYSAFLNALRENLP